MRHLYPSPEAKLLAVLRYSDSQYFAPRVFEFTPLFRLRGGLIGRVVDVVWCRLNVTRTIECPM